MLCAMLRNFSAILTWKPSLETAVPAVPIDISRLVGEMYNTVFMVAKMRPVLPLVWSTVNEVIQISPPLRLSVPS